ncbi:hypothetical protein [Streptomyces sp. NPDC018031]|uniref:hypothetical protein n=1 Tax=Streptomyces sp. NPDC018031 TaxID=3365033 RepID=UPI003799460C
MNVALTAGGLLVGLVILAWYGVRWWHANKNKKQSKDWKALGPLGYGVLLGILGAAVTGGILGWVFTRVRSASNATGEKVLGSATGANGHAVASTQLPPLTVGGAILTVLVFVAAIALWKRWDKAEQKMIGAGAVSGATLGTSAGVAGSGALALVPLINSIGDSLVTSI